jgi:sugar lactone lactonase YvrE
LLETKTLLLPAGTKLSDGNPVNFIDDLDVDKDGIIYFSDASSRSNIHSLILEVLGGPTGRLVQYDPKTKNSEVLIDGLHFANGVQLSKKEDFVLISETMGERVWRQVENVRW